MLHPTLHRTHTIDEMLCPHTHTHTHTLRIHIIGDMLHPHTLRPHH